MELGLEGQVVLVTGASKGIGFACAEAFAREGAKVALVSRSRENLDAALGRIGGAARRPVAFVADLIDATQAARAVDETEAALGPIDVLVNSAGAARRYPPSELNAQAWHAAMDAKFFSYIHPLDIVVKRMGERGHGAVVNIVGMGGKTANPVHLPGGAANSGATASWITTTFSSDTRSTRRRSSRVAWETAMMRSAERTARRELKLEGSEWLCLRRRDPASTTLH